MFTCIPTAKFTPHGIRYGSKHTFEIIPATVEVISTFYLVPDNSYVQGIFPEDIAEYTMVKGYDVTLYGTGELGDQEYTRMKQNENKAVVIDIKLKPLHERKSKRLWENKVVIPKFAEEKEYYKPVGHKYTKLHKAEKLILYQIKMQLTIHNPKEPKAFQAYEILQISCQVI